MHILCFAIPEKGHVNPLVPTLRRLEAAGHTVVVAAPRDIASTLVAAGLQARFVLLDAAPPPAHFIRAGRAFAERLREPAWLSGWIEALLIDSVPAQLPGVNAVLERERPHVVVADPMLYAVAIACAQRGVPWAALSSSLNPVTPPSWRTALTDTLDHLHDKRAALFRDAGVEVPRFFVSDAESPWLNVAFTTQAYVPHAVDPAITLVGAPFDRTDIALRAHDADFPWQRLAEGPKLYVSFGSQAFYQPRLFQRVFDAASALGLSVIASVGDLIDDRAFVASAPPNAVLARYTPQLEVLDVVDIVVSHGGANSVVETLAAEKPLLLLTLCNDQPLQARFLEASGAGLAFDAAHGDADSSVIAGALTRLLGDSVRDRVRALGRALRNGGGPDRAASLIDELARTHPRAAGPHVPPEKTRSR